MEVVAFCGSMWNLVESGSLCVPLVLVHELLLAIASLSFDENDMPGNGSLPSSYNNKNNYNGLCWRYEREIDRSRAMCLKVFFTVLHVKVLMCDRQAIKHYFSCPPPSSIIILSVLPLLFYPPLFG